MSMDKMFMRFLRREGVQDMQRLSERPQLRGEPGHERLLLSVAKPDQIQRLFAKLFDESEFLSPHGLRALSAYHRDHPYHFDIGDYRASIDYEPAESTTSMFGGNSNWRGPIWMPVHYLLVESLERYHRFYGNDLELEYPTGSGKTLTLDLIAADLQDRLISLFTNDADVLAGRGSQRERPTGERAGDGGIGRDPGGRDGADRGRGGWVSGHCCALLLGGVMGPGLAGRLRGPGPRRGGAGSGRRSGRSTRSGGRRRSRRRCRCGSTR